MRPSSVDRENGMEPLDLRDAVFSILAAEEAEEIIAVLPSRHEQAVGRVHAQEEKACCVGEKAWVKLAGYEAELSRSPARVSYHARGLMRRLQRLRLGLK